MKPFKTNYCTGFSTGTPENPNQWKQCCVEHDLYFWAGGCKEFRLIADRRLRRCVEDSGARQIALLMYLGVRLGSYSPFKIKEERWGNGWVDGRPDFQKLIPADLEELSKELSLNPPNELTPETITSFMETLKAQVSIPSECGKSSLVESL